MSAVNGFRARRLSRGLTMQQLAEESGVSAYTVRCCEEGKTERISLDRLLTLTEALELTLSEACRVRETTGTRQRPRRREPRNVLENYMARWDLTVQGLAVILDVSAQTVSVQCGKKDPSLKYVRRLAEEEGLPVGTFLKLYENEIWTPAG